MGYVKRRTPRRLHDIIAARNGNIAAEFFTALRPLLILIAVFLIGCGENDSGISKSKQYVAHDAIKIDGETANESYLKISSTIEGEAAVSVTHGGRLTLHDATIWKIGDEASGSPTYGMAEIGGDQQPNDGTSEPPISTDPTSEDNPVGGTSSGVLAGELMPAEDLPDTTNPGPGATHAGVYAGSGGTVSLSNVSVETSSGEGSGLYASGEGSSITLINGTITTDGSTAHGVFATHKGRVDVENVTIITKGEHSSALATFKGNGTITATGGTYTAFGKYSAGIYSTSDILLSGVICKSVSDLAAVLDGGSRITLKDSILWSREMGGVMIYQSYSGHSPLGPARFEMTGGSLSADDGPIFYITNTAGSILLKHVDIYGASGILMKALKGTWDVDLVAEPVQGAEVTLIADGQSLPGDIIMDEFSVVSATLKNGTTLTGAINADNRGKEARLTLDHTSAWHVTADSYLTALTFFNGISNSGITNIIGNGHTVFYDRDASPALGGKVYDLPKGGKLMPKQT